jgi:hypothetical protein
MALNWETVKTNIYNWVVANVPSGMPATMYYENAPRPAAPYVTINIASITQIGWDWTPNPTNTAGDISLIGDREFTVQLQAYGGDPLSVMENLRTSLQKQGVLDLLRVNGIVFADWFPINDITELVDSRYEKRASMDVLFRIAQTATESLGTIATVELQEVYVDAVDDVVYDETFLIPPAP